VTVKEQFVVPAGVVQFTVVVPIWNCEPEAGMQLVVQKVTTALQSSRAALAVILDGQVQGGGRPIVNPCQNSPIGTVQLMDVCLPGN